MSDQQPNGTSPAEATRIEPAFTPPTDIVETTAGVQMALDMPGADPDSLDVTLDNRVLRISARSQPSAPEGYALVHAEYRDGNYERSFTVSEPIDAGRIEAVLRDGVLRLTLPKAAPSPAAKINVTAA